MARVLFQKIYNNPGMKKDSIGYHIVEIESVANDSFSVPPMPSNTTAAQALNNSVVSVTTGDRVVLITGGVVGETIEIITGHENLGSFTEGVVPGAGPVLANSVFSTDFEGQGSAQRLRSTYTDTDAFTSAPMGSFSVSLWFEVDVLMANQAGPCGSSTVTNFLNGWGIQKAQASDNAYRFHAGAFNISFYESTAHTGIWTPNDGWKHLVLVFDAPNRQGTVYLNAVQDQSSINQFNTTRVLGGRHTVGNANSIGAVAADFNGKIDTAAFWPDVILTQEDVDSLYNLGVPRDPTDVVAGAAWYITLGDDALDTDPSGFVEPFTDLGNVQDQTGNGNNFNFSASDNTPPITFSTDVP